MKEGQPSLQSLDDVPWSALHHAYGSAADVPGQIRTLLAPDPKLRQSTLFSFTCNIFHQGTRYPATVAAIPFFIEMLRYDGVAERAGVLDTLVHLATGFPEQPWTMDDLDRLLQAADPLQKMPPPDDRWCDPEYLVEASIVARECYAEAAAGYPVYVALIHEADVPVAIAAAFLLAFFPMHAYGAGEILLRIVQDEGRHGLLRASCLMSLAFLRGANALDATTTYCNSVITADLDSANPVPIHVAAAVAFLLSVTEEGTSKVNQADLKRTADACLKQGIEEAVADFYEQREEPNQIETSEEYYAAFLAPVTQFPWPIEATIQRQVQNRFRKNKASPDVEAHDDRFTMDDVLQELAETEAANRALSLARLLLKHAFGESFGMTVREFSDRVFPVSDWNETQRRVLQAIADCKLAWPDIAFLLHMSLDLEFDPTRQELADALAGKQRTPKPEEDEAPPTDFSEAAVLAAVKRLYESFALGQRKLQKELKRFEPFLPHSEIGVDFLVDRLTNGETLKERKSAAWALGRLGPHAVNAVPHLVRHMTEDPENDYANSALGYIPIDHDTAEELCDRVETIATDVHPYLRILRDSISTERLLCWLDASPKLRWTALTMLSRRCPERIRNHLLAALEDEDENLQRVARDALGQASLCEWYFSSIDTLTPDQRSAIAESFCRNRTDLSEHRSELFAVVQSTDSEDLAANLLGTVIAFPGKTSEDIAELVRSLDRFATATWKLELIGILRGCHSCGFDRQLIEAIGSLLDDRDPYVRMLAAKSLGRFPTEDSRVDELLMQSWSDESDLVTSTVLWSQAYRGPAACDFLMNQLQTEQNDRIAAELVWALSAQQCSIVDLEATCGALAPTSLAKSVIEAIKHRE